MYDNVNHPSHYQSEEGIEVIDVIAAFTKKLSGVDAFDIGCAIKYILRFTEKNGIEDLKKAIWYINDYIKRNHKEDYNEQLEQSTSVCHCRPDVFWEDNPEKHDDSGWIRAD